MTEDRGPGFAKATPGRQRSEVRKCGEGEDQYNEGGEELDGEADFGREFDFVAVEAEESNGGQGHPEENRQP